MSIQWFLRTDKFHRLHVFNYPHVRILSWKMHNSWIISPYWIFKRKIIKTVPSALLKGHSSNISSKELDQCAMIVYFQRFYWDYHTQLQYCCDQVLNLNGIGVISISRFWKSGRETPLRDSNLQDQILNAVLFVGWPQCGPCASTTHPNSTVHLKVSGSWLWLFVRKCTQFLSKSLRYSQRVYSISGW